MAKFELDEKQQAALERLHEWAECKDKPAHYFDGTDPKSYLVMAALESCDVCAVKRECLIVIQPKEMYFDGVAGGRIFNHGKEIRRK